MYGIKDYIRWANLQKRKKKENKVCTIYSKKKKSSSGAYSFLTFFPWILLNFKYIAPVFWPGANGRLFISWGKGIKGNKKKKKSLYVPKYIQDFEIYVLDLYPKGF